MVPGIVFFHKSWGVAIKECPLAVWDDFVKEETGESKRYFKSTTFYLTRVTLKGIIVQGKNSLYSGASLFLFERIGRLVD